MNQRRDLESFYRKLFGKQMVSPTITYDKRKTYIPIRINDLKFQVDYVTPEKNFEGNVLAPTDTDLYDIILKHKEIKMVSDGRGINGIEVF